MTNETKQPTLPEVIVKVREKIVAVQKSSAIEGAYGRAIQKTLLEALALLDSALEAENKSLKELFTVDKDGRTMGDRYLDLKAENASLTKERDEYKEQHIELCRGFGAQQATIAQQAEQLAATEKDAERYRWLRSNHPIHDNSPFICRNFGAAFSQWTDDQADKAIDTAIAASREWK